MATNEKWFDGSPVPSLSGGQDYWFDGVPQPAISSGSGAYSLNCAAGSFTLTGNAATFNRSRHRYWRLNFTATYANNSVRLQEVELYTAVGGADVTGSGTASAEAGNAAQAFDNNTGTEWDTLSGGGGLPDWLQYDFGAGNEKDIVSIGLFPNSTTLQCPKNFDVLYSDDGSTWTTYWSITNASFPGGGGAGSTFSKFTDPAHVNNYTLTCAAGSFAVTGVSALLSEGKGIAGYAGAFTVSGQAVGFLRTYRLAANAGAFTVSGQSAGLGESHALTLSAGSFTLTGKDAALSKGIVAPLGAGAFTVTGQSAGLGETHALSCAAGAFTLTGKDAGLGRNYKLTLATGAFTVTGYDVPLATIDPYFPDVVLLIGGDGANASTAFTDESSYHHTLTANGNAQITTSQVLTGTGSVLLDGTGDFISCPTGIEFALGGAFTVESFVRPSETTDWTIIGLWSSFTANASWALGHIGGVLTWKFYDQSGTLRSLTYNWNPTVGTWYHIAVSRDLNSGTTRLRVNGVVVAKNTTWTPPRYVAGGSLFVGRQSGSALYDLNGRLDELRVTNFKDRYDTDSTVTIHTGKKPRQGFQIVGAAGSYVFSGKAASLKFAHRLAANAGSFAITGKKASLTYGALARGEFTVTGGTIRFLRTYRLVAGAGAFHFSGWPDLLTRQRRLVCASRAFLLNGKSVIFRRTYVVPLPTAHYTVTGKDIRLGLTRSLRVAAGAFTLTGLPAALTKHKRPTFIIGAIEVYPAFVAMVSVDKALNGAADVSPAITGSPKANRWAA